MQTDQQICCDAVKTFCEEYIAKHRAGWPTDEMELAQSFVKHFNIPPLTNIIALSAFAAETKIDLVQDDIPGNLLGLNITFLGKQRKIFVSRDPKHIAYQVHTVLHEIREVLENTFRSLGFGTVDAANLEQRADEFAFAAFLCSGADTFKGYVDSASKIESSWRKWGTLGLIGVGAAVMALYSFVAAFHPRAGMRSPFKHPGKVE